MRNLGVEGFLKKPKLTPKGKTYTGRFVFPDVQWTGKGDDLLATFTVTAEQVADAAASDLIFTDQEVQRGIVPGSYPIPKVELSMSEGFPDRRYYVFDEEKANTIAEKLLKGEKLFLNPLIWNLRPGLFTAFFDEETKDMYLYEGKIYLPDSHHRQQAIIKAVKIWREAPKDYPKFSPTREFKVDLYFLSRIMEGDFFFEKNQLTKATARSKAFDLTTKDSLSLLAKSFIDMTPELSNNINRVTDRLTSRNPQVTTLSTVREMMKTFVEDDAIDPDEIEGYAGAASRFYRMLANVRPELGHLNRAERKQSRDESLVAVSVMFHGYAELMKAYYKTISAEGTSSADRKWRSKLARFGPDVVYRCGSWAGDLFDKANPFWLKRGVLKIGSKGQKTIVSSGASRSSAGTALLDVVNSKALNLDEVR